MQELQTEMVAMVPGGTHDMTKECNTLTNSVSINVSVQICKAFVGGIITLSDIKIHVIQP